MKFHITITDNETGKTIHESDTNAILAGIHTEEGADAIVLTDCNIQGLLSTIHSAKAALEQCTENDPLLAALIALTEGNLLKKKETASDNNEKEGE